MVHRPRYSFYHLPHQSHYLLLHNHRTPPSWPTTHPHYHKHPMAPNLNLFSKLSMPNMVLSSILISVLGLPFLSPTVLWPTKLSFKIHLSSPIVLKPFLVTNSYPATSTTSALLFMTQHGVPSVVTSPPRCFIHPRSNHSLKFGSGFYTLLSTVSKLHRNLKILLRLFLTFIMLCSVYLFFLCFGERVNDDKISIFNILNYFWPKVAWILLRKQWEELLKLRRDQEDVLLPLIRLRKQVKKSKLNNANTVVSYVNTLLELELPKEKQKLTYASIMSH